MALNKVPRPLTDLELTDVCFSTASVRWHESWLQTEADGPASHDGLPIAPGSAMVIDLPSLWQR